MDELHLLRIERHEDTLLVTPTTDLDMLKAGAATKEAEAALRALDDSNIKHVVIDLVRTRIINSTAMGLFVRFWRAVHARGGQVAFCHVSTTDREMMERTKLDSLWQICSCKEEALQAVRS